MHRFVQEEGMATQISVFVENKPGRLNRVAKILGRENINIRAVTISDRGEYGLINLITDDPEKTFKALENAGFTVSRKKVIGVIMDDRPGSLSRVTELLESNGINVTNAYGFLLQEKGKAVLVFEVKDYEKALEKIENAGFQTITEDDLHNI